MPAAFAASSKAQADALGQLRGRQGDAASEEWLVNQNLEIGREAMERARAAQGGHNSGHSDATRVLIGRLLKTVTLGMEKV